MSRAYLHSHRDLRGLMQHLLDSAVVTLSKLLIQLQLAHIDGKRGPVREVDALCVQDGFAAEI